MVSRRRRSFARLGICGVLVAVVLQPVSARADVDADSQPAADTICVTPTECFPATGPNGYTFELDQLIGGYAAELMTIGSKYPGYIDGGVNYLSRSVELYWRGDVPAEVQAFTSRMVKDQVGLTIIPVPYTRTELEAATKTVVQAVIADGIGLTTIRPALMKGEITFAGPKLSTDKKLQARVREIAAGLVGDIPITFIPNEVGSDLADTRLNDHSPYKAGGRLYAGDGSGCSSGLPVTSGSDHYLMTAAHCADYDNGSMFSTGAHVNLHVNMWTKTLYGTTTGGDPYGGPRFDATLIQVSNVTAKTFLGDRDSGTTGAINGYDPWPASTTACMSGSYNGNNCGILRTASDVELIPVQGFYSWVGRASAPFPSTSWIWGSGDSGGPIYRVQGGLRKVVGLVKGEPGLSSAPCPVPGGAHCVYNGFFTPMNRIMDEVLNKKGFYVGG